MTRLALVLTLALSLVLLPLAGGQTSQGILFLQEETPSVASQIPVNALFHAWRGLV